MVSMPKMRKRKRVAHLWTIFDGYFSDEPLIILLYSFKTIAGQGQLMSCQIRSNFKIVS